MCMAIRRRAREAQISRFKASFAYCASRRRVFGRPITVACHFPLGYFFSLFLCRSSEVRCPFPGFCVFLSFPRVLARAHASRRIISTTISRSRCASKPEDPTIPGESTDHPRSRMSARRSFWHHPNHLGRSLGHSRDFHSSEARPANRSRADITLLLGPVVTADHLRSTMSLLITSGD